jgi:hypothetical protein
MRRDREADLLIAGDKDLLVLGSHHGIQIISPAEYVRGDFKKQ